MIKLRSIITGVLLLAPLITHADCTRVTSTSLLSSEVIAAGYTATTWAGGGNFLNGPSGLPSVISLSTSSDFMPGGTLLATSTASFLTASNSKAYTSNQILYRCALADAGSLEELYVTQSYYLYAGRTLTTDIESAYHTYVNGVAVRLTNMKTGKYYESGWQARTLTSDEWVQDDTYIYIPASAFSDTFVEVFKTDSTAYTAGNSSAIYSYGSVASGFIAFRAPGLNTASLVDGALETVITGYYNNWPGQISMYQNVTFVRGAMCLVKDYPSVVLLPTMSISSLNSGETSQSSFSISLKCEDAAVSSVGTTAASTAVAMGFLVNQPTAVTAATNLGLTTSSGGLTHLLDTNYGSSGSASGVGIKIYNESGTALSLLPSRTTRTGNLGGWYAYKDLTTSQGDSTNGVTTYTGNFTASLEAISGETVTAGSVNAQLQVVVSFQ